MSIRVRIASSALKIFSTDQTPVYVDVQERNRANFFEIEIESSPVDLSYFEQSMRTIAEWSLRLLTVSRYISDARGCSVAICETSSSISTTCSTPATSVTP